MTRNDVIAKVREIVAGRSCDEAVHALVEEGLIVGELPTPALPVGQMRINMDGEIIAVRFNEETDPWNCSDGLNRSDSAVRDWPILVPEADLDQLRAERDRLAARVAELEAVEECAFDEDVASLCSRLAEFVQAETWTLIDTLAFREIVEDEEFRAAACAVDADALARVMDDARYAWFKGRGEPITLVQAFADAIREHLPDARRPALPEGHVAVDMSGIEDGILGMWSRADHDDWLGRAASSELDRRAKAGEVE